MTTQVLDDRALDRLFRSARSIHTFKTDPLPDSLLRQLYDLLKWGPTAFNAQPARYVFVRSAEAKARLSAALSGSNQAKSFQAPATVIVAYDTRFFERLPGQSRGSRIVDLFSSNAALAETTALRNSSLQGAYLILAARCLGFAVGPMSGFDADRINQEFFPDGRHRVNFLSNIGYPGDSELRPRGHRFEFHEVVEVL